MQRIKVGLKQTDLAELVKISVPTITRLENGRSDPKTEELSRLAVALNTSVAYLIGETNEPDRSASNTADSNISEIIVPRGGFVQVPVLDMSTCAGRGWTYDFADVDIERYEELPAFMVGIIDEDRPPFMIRISGDSMEDADMPDGAYAVINPSEVVHSGDAAMCQYGAFRDVALKWVYFMPDGAIELRSATPGYPVIRYENGSEKFEYEPLVIIGKVTATVGRPKRG